MFRIVFMLYVIYMGCHMGAVMCICVAGNCTGSGVLAGVDHKSVPDVQDIGIICVLTSVSRLGEHLIMLI